ncbi:hypothetical protein B0H19DRAFT_1263392 [Mycena capillaripes]|nr:hypothetical protein B0H19DRAFT_1263392 [Mycena capillaripes]
MLIAGEVTRSSTSHRPDLATAVHDMQGHPLFPASAEDASEYEGSDDSSSATHTSKYTKAEKLRIRRATEKVSAALGPLRLPSARDAKVLGVWYASTLRHTRTLPTYCAGPAWEFIVQADKVRSEGIAYIMSQQAAIKRAYQWATTGTVPIRKVKKAKSPFHDSELTIGDELVPELARDVPAPPLPCRASALAPYLGVSPPGDDEFDIPHSHMSVDEARNFFEVMDTHNWPPAMCTKDGEWPKHKHARPLLDDVRVACTLRHLLPEEDENGNMVLVQMMEQAMLLFSVEGMYTHNIFKGNLRFHIRPINEHFNFDTSTLTFSHIASYFCMHGIAPTSDDVLCIESYAPLYRNRVAGKTDPHNTSFDSWPHDVSCIQMLDDESIIKWTDLDNGPLRPGRSLAYPRRPGSFLPRPGTPVLLPEDIDMEGTMSH